MSKSRSSYKWADEDVQDDKKTQITNLEERRQAKKLKNVFRSKKLDPRDIEEE